MGIELQLFDMERFAKGLNKSLDCSEEMLAIAGYRETIHLKKNQITVALGVLDGNAVQSIGTYDILQPHGLGFMHPFNKHGKRGHIYVETGEKAPTDFHIFYEFMRINLYSSLKLAEGRYAPKCMIVMEQILGDNGTYSMYRLDYISRFGFKMGTDLSEVIRTEWLLSDMAVRSQQNFDRDLENQGLMKYMRSAQDCCSAQ